MVLNLGVLIVASNRLATSFKAGYTCQSTSFEHHKCENVTLGIGFICTGGKWVPVDRDHIQEKAFEKSRICLPLEVALVMIPLTVIGASVLLTPHFKACEVMWDDFSLLTTTCVL